MKIFDAHVHIVPRGCLGTGVRRYGVKLERFGKMRFPDGSCYPNLPAYIEDSCFTPEALLALMEDAGVEKAVLLQSPFLDVSEKIAQATEAWPGRFVGAMQLDPEPGWEEKMEYWSSRGLNAVKFVMRGMTSPEAWPDLKLDSPLMMGIWAKMEKLQLTAVVDPGPIGWAGYQPAELRRAVETHPDLHFVICHLGFPSPRMREYPEILSGWEAMTALAQYETVWFDVSAMPDLFMEEGYPFPGALETFRRFYDRYGAKKALWGSDIPGTLNNATYRQMRQLFECADFLSDTDKENLFYYNAEKAYLRRSDGVIPSHFKKRSQKSI